MKVIMNFAVIESTRQRYYL